MTPLPLTYPHARRRLSLLWYTLVQCAYTLVAFTLGFCVLTTGFALFGQLAFGALAPDFHTFASSFSALLRYPLGAFNYAEIEQVRRDWVPAHPLLLSGDVACGRAPTRYCLSHVVGVVSRVSTAAANTRPSL